MYFFDVQDWMYFIPVVIVLAIVAADTVDANATTDFWRLQPDWINYLANYKWTGTFEVFNKFET